VEVRLATPEDARAVAEVYIASFATLAFLSKLHTDEAMRGFIQHTIDTSEVWVAEDADAIVGMASLSPEMLDHLYVHPDAQGRGAGSALLDKATERRPGGFTFWVFQQNEPARRFYERRGCRVVKLTDGSGNKEKTPDALYEWRPE
jgi:ribosomal protein S18 acetylase RimI-like enzyme